MNGKTKSTNISYKWPYIVMEWERRENRISSRKWLVVQKCQILSQPPFPAMLSINEMLFPETTGNNSRHVDSRIKYGALLVSAAVL